MIKKTVSYEGFDGETITEDLYFHLSKAELLEMELEHDGGFSNYLENVVKADGGREIINAFKEIISRSYGVRSEDGKRFIKTKEAADAFLSSEAYSELFMSIATDAESAAEFVNGLIPKGLRDQVAEELPHVPATDEQKAQIEELQRRIAEIKGQ